MSTKKRTLFSISYKLQKKLGYFLPEHVFFRAYIGPKSENGTEKRKKQSKLGISYFVQKKLKCEKWPIFFFYGFLFQLLLCFRSKLGQTKLYKINKMRSIIRPLLFQ